MTTTLDSPPRLLVVDDEPYVLRAIKRTLGRQGCEVLTATDDLEALEIVQAHDVDIALLDMKLQTTTGVKLMRRLQQHDPTLQCIIFTGDAGPDVAYEALSEGAADYFHKPIEDWGRFNEVLRTSTQQRRAMVSEGLTARPKGGGRDEVVAALLKGRSASMKSLRRQVGRIAPLGLSVMVLGPTGSGKSHLARALHEASGRPGELEMVNCAMLGDANRAWSELFGHEKGAYTGAHERFIGCFERAAGRTVFLDEIGELPPEAQSTLLHVLEEGVFRRMGGTADQKLSARVIAATNRDLYREAATGRFSDALLSRFDMVLQVPALQERPEDIPLLTWSFLRDLEAEEGLMVRSVEPGVFEALHAFPWSDGNVRQLRNVLKRMAVFAEDEALTTELLPPDLQGLGARMPVRRGPLPLVDEDSVQGNATVHDLPPRFRGMPYAGFKAAVLEEYTRSYLVWCLAEAGGNITRAADRAEIRRPNFKRLMNKFGVSTPKGDV